MNNHNRSIPLYGENYHNKGSAQIAQQLTLTLDTPQDPVANLFKKRRKRQIVCTPGVDLRNPYKYRVMAGDTILGDHLTLEKALQVAKRGEQ